MARRKNSSFLSLAGKSVVKAAKFFIEPRPEKGKARKEPKKIMPEAAYTELNVLKTTDGDYESFSRTLQLRSLIILIFGRRGSGKSTLGFRILENLHAKRKSCFVLGVRQKLLPDWITEIQNMEEVKNGAAVLVDEGAIAYSSRQSMRKENIELGKLLAIARHKDLTLVLVTQNTSMIDKAVLNLADVVMAKEGSLLQKQMERTAIRNFVSTADKAIKKYPAVERVKLVYIFADDFEGLCEISLPSFWSQSISKSHSQP